MNVGARCSAVRTFEQFKQVKLIMKVHIKLDRSVYKQGQHIKPEVEVTLETGKVTHLSFNSC